MGISDSEAKDPKDPKGKGKDKSNDVDQLLSKSRFFKPEDPKGKGKAKAP